MHKVLHFIDHLSKDVVQNKESDIKGKLPIDYKTKIAGIHIAKVLLTIPKRHNEALRPTFG